MFCQPHPCCQHVVIVRFLFFNYVELFDFGCCSLAQQMSFVQMPCFSSSLSPVFCQPFCLSRICSLIVCKEICSLPLPPSLVHFLLCASFQFIVYCSGFFFFVREGVSLPRGLSHGVSRGISCGTWCSPVWSAKCLAGRFGASSGGGDGGGGSPPIFSV
jgi:hypothetical protein